MAALDVRLGDVETEACLAFGREPQGVDTGRQVDGLTHITAMKTACNSTLLGPNSVFEVVAITVRSAADVAVPSAHHRSRPITQPHHKTTTASALQAKTRVSDQSLGPGFDNSWASRDSSAPH